MFDANTVVSAALTPGGTSRRAIALARMHGIIALSEPVFREIAEVLGRPKFAQVLTADRRNEILELLSAAAIWANPAEAIWECRDGKDNRYLELALAVSASVIVSGDSDLLDLDPWRGIRVIKPAAFVVEMDGGGFAD